MLDLADVQPTLLRDCVAPVPGAPESLCAEQWREVGARRGDLLSEIASDGSTVIMEIDGTELSQAIVLPYMTVFNHSHNYNNNNNNNTNNNNNNNDGTTRELNM